MPKNHFLTACIIPHELIKIILITKSNESAQYDCQWAYQKSYRLLWPGSRCHFEILELVSSEINKNDDGIKNLYSYNSDIWQCDLLRKASHFTDDSLTDHIDCSNNKHATNTLPKSPATLINKTKLNIKHWFQLPHNLLKDVKSLIVKKIANGNNALISIKKMHLVTLENGQGLSYTE